MAPLSTQTTLPGDNQNTRNPQYRDIYSNSTGVTISQYDVRLLFSETKPGEDGQVVEAQATIAMSPQHFKVFCASLQQTLAAYESGFGEINVRPEALADVQNAEELVEKIRAMHKI